MNSQNFDTKYLENGDRYDVGRRAAVTCRTNRLSIGAVTLDDPERSKIKVKLFGIKYVKNGNSYDVVPIGFTLDDLERLKVKVTNGAVTAIGMWGYTPVGLNGVLV